MTKTTFGFCNVTSIVSAIACAVSYLNSLAIQALEEKPIIGMIKPSKLIDQLKVMKTKL